MKTRLMLSAAIWALLGWRTVQAQVIVVNRGVKIADISKSDLRDIFIGASSNYKDGSRAVPVVLRGGPLQETFLKVYAGKNEAAFLATWRTLVFAGQGTIPKSFDAETALIDYVASVPGAIGYVSAPTDREKVKSLAVK
jgi:hypothetical protein